MLITIPDLLTREEVAHIRGKLERTQWQDGLATAGDQAAGVKKNLQVPMDSDEGARLSQIVLAALARNPVYQSAALPLNVLPPMFNRYDEGMTFGNHVDGSIRVIPQNGQRIRTDVSTTVFITDDDEYDGGELIVEDTYGEHRVKLPAGHAVVYPSTSLHRVNPVTRGSRWASFFWAQSMIRDDWRRHMMYDLDRSIMRIRSLLPDDDPAVTSLTAHYHNMIRQWAEV
ncbi:Fe2+-dependent dioxygenase [Paracoccus seriniphilus]|uniref:PKHD-type hydroxylase n=1 Tax=Paracoccus seriniphilus TaxID=184748 RepID=A0A239PQT2_9RHOB|nr:Fe2+-dependent dioxygenase [Paracoccus seriniphilus]WCR12934.1 Fe2+-dependent dioxygenase [Paracoccus seriniphilus]SNT72635.1 PKHD-type hydroxylase [Paracoccus seriniphilus]